MCRSPTSASSSVFCSVFSSVPSSWSPSVRPVPCHIRKCVDNTVSRPNAKSHISFILFQGRRINNETSSRVEPLLIPLCCTPPGSSGNTRHVTKTTLPCNIPRGRNKSLSRFPDRDPFFPYWCAGFKSEWRSNCGQDTGTQPLVFNSRVSFALGS
jgi:hypothetical protein